MLHYQSSCYNYHGSRCKLYAVICLCSRHFLAYRIPFVFSHPAISLHPNFTLNIILTYSEHTTISMFLCHYVLYYIEYPLACQGFPALVLLADCCHSAKNLLPSGKCQAELAGGWQEVDRYRELGRYCIAHEK